MQYVYQFELKYKKEVETLLAKDPYADNSFARLGYVVKESNTLGLKGGFLVVYFKTQDDSLAKNLVDQLKTISSCTELAPGDKLKAISVIEAEETNAASGFGSIFG